MAAAGESIRATDGKRVAADLIERVGREGRSARSAGRVRA